MTASRRSWAAAPIIVVAALAAFWPALHGGFVWDDAMHVTPSGLTSWHGLALIWFRLGATQQYYPLLHTAFWIEHRLWGDRPWCYHLFNVAAHGAASVLVFATLRRLQVRGAALAALLFAVHPVMAESVAWISEEKNTLSAVFYSGAAFVYLGIDRRRARSGYGWATILFVAAVLTKTVAATLPAALLVALWWRDGVTARRDVLRLAPWLVFGAGMGVVTAWVERRYIGAAGGDFALDPVQRCFLAGRVLWVYVEHLVWPRGLMFFYPRWNWSWSWAWLWGAPAWIALLAAAWVLRRRTRAPLAAALIFTGTLFPALGFANVYPFIFSYVADHFEYLAAVPIFAAIAATCCAAMESSAAIGGVARIAAGEALIALASMSRSECRWYESAETFYRSILVRNPAAWLAENNLGWLLFQEGRAREARPHLEQAIRLRPAYTEAEMNLGVLELQAAHYGAAEQHLGRAVEQQPRVPPIRVNWGFALEKTGQRGAALTQYRIAYAQAPDFALAREHLIGALVAEGAACDQRRDWARAQAAYREAVAVAPQDADLHAALGVSVYLAGDAATAAKEFREALRLRPDDRRAAADLKVAERALSRNGKTPVSRR